MPFKAHEASGSAGTAAACGLPSREGEVVRPGPGLCWRARLSLQRVCPAQERGQRRAEVFVMMTVAQAARCGDGDGGSTVVPVSGAGCPRRNWCQQLVGDVPSEHPGSPLLLPFPEPGALPGLCSPLDRGWLS